MLSFIRFTFRKKKTKRDKKLYLKSFGANRLREEILRKLPWFSLLLQAGWPPLMAHLPRESYRLRGLKRSHASKACNNNTQSHWNISKPSLVSKIQIQLQKWLHNKGECVGYMLQRAWEFVFGLIVEDVVFLPLLKAAFFVTPRCFPSPWL